MGKPDEFDAEKAREAAGEIACQLRDLGVKTIAIPTPSDAPSEMIQAATEGSLLALYQFNEHKTEGLDEVKELDAVTFLIADEDGKSPPRKGCSNRQRHRTRDDAGSRFEQSTGQ